MAIPRFARRRHRTWGIFMLQSGKSVRSASEVGVRWALLPRLLS